MSLDYISPPLLQRKRGREGGEGGGEGGGGDLQSKRVCNGLGSCVQLEYGVLTESPMDTWEPQQVRPLKNTTFNHHHSSTKVLVGAAQQCCPRCMAGEPGHINHIMQRY